MFLVIFGISFIHSNVGWAATSITQATEQFIDGKMAVTEVARSILRAPGDFEDKVNLVIAKILNSNLKKGEKGNLLLQLSYEFQLIEDNRDSRNALWLSGALTGAVAGLIFGPSLPPDTLFPSLANFAAGVGVSAGAAVAASAVWSRISGEHQVNAEGISRLTQTCEQILSDRRIQPIAPEAS